MTFVILLAILGWLAYRIFSSEERERYVAAALAQLRRVKVAATEPGPEYEAFREELRVRMPRAFVTLAIAIVCGIVGFGMLFGAGAMSDPHTLLGWGASVGTRTTNGEWWRLVTSAFVPTGILHALVNLAVLLHLGGILERFTGRWTLAAAYLSAGIFAALVSVSGQPVGVTTSFTAAIFGLYGLMSSVLLWQIVYEWRRNPEAEPEEGAAPVVMIPPVALKRLGVIAAAFIIYSAFIGCFRAPELTGLSVGFVYGLALAWRVNEKEPVPKHVGIAAAATLVIAAVCAFELRNIADVNPEIARVLAAEDHTSATYQSGLDAFRKGRTTAEGLAQLTEAKIIPELQAVDARLERLSNVPSEYQALVAEAREYLRLRCDSWRARSNAIRKTNADPRRAADILGDGASRLQAEARFRSNLAVLGTAERAERASLDAFQRIKDAMPSGPLKPIME